MKTVNIKNGFCALLALPVVVLRCLLAHVDYCLGICDMKLRYGVWPEMHKEAGPIGRRVVMCHHDRHLYAVLKPTRAENLQRIRNVLSAIGFGID